MGDVGRNVDYVPHGHHMLLAATDRAVGAVFAINDLPALFTAQNFICAPNRNISP